MPELIDRVISFVSSLSPTVMLLSVLVMMVVETSLLVGMLIPGEVVVLIAAATLDIGWAPVVALAALVGTLIGQSGGFWIGRLVGPALRNGRLGRAIGRDRWEFAEAVIHGSGGRSMISTRFVAVLHAVVPVVVGSLRLPYRRFLRLAMAGAVLWAVVQTCLGLAIGQASRALGQRWTPLVFGVLGLTVAVFLLVRAVRRHRKEHSARSSATAGAGQDESGT